MDPDVDRTVEVRVKLPVLPRRCARRDDAQLPPRKVEAGPAEDLAVPFDDHPRIERGMQGADVLPKRLVAVAVDAGAVSFTTSAPPFGVRVFRSLIVARCRGSG